MEPCLLHTDLEAASLVSEAHLAMNRASEWLWNQQRADGTWDSACDVGPIGTAQMLIGLDAIGRLSQADGQQGAQWLIGQQHPNGSFLPYPFAREGDRAATAICCSALCVCGMPLTAEPVRRALSYIDSQGGMAQVVELLGKGSVAALFAAYSGLLDPKYLPCPSVLPLLLRPVQWLLLRRINPGALLFMLQYAIVIRFLRGHWGQPGQSQGWLESRARNQALQWLDEYQNEDGGWMMGDVLQVSLVLLTLGSLGLDPDDDRKMRGAAWAEQQAVRSSDGLYFNSLNSAIWTTTYNLRALIHAGAPVDCEEVVRPIEWLVDQQVMKPQPPACHHKSSPSRTGAWCFQLTNDRLVDSDDTSAVVGLLQMALDRGGKEAWQPDLVKRARRSIDLGAEWLLDMQNSDGGFATFVEGLPGKPAGAILKESPQIPIRGGLLAKWRFFRNPPFAFGDPAMEDITGRVLSCLGRCGYPTSHPIISKAIAFLQRMQCESGPWWGRWAAYIWATPSVLQGLADTQADLNAAWVRRGIHWLVDRQNADGGWGELETAYRHPEKAGCGPSMPSPSGQVLAALMAVGELEHPAVARGIRYLIEVQNSNGTWPWNGHLQTYIAPDSFYHYPPADVYSPLEALALFVARKQEALL